MAIKMNRKQGNADPLLDYRTDLRLNDMTARLAAIEQELPSARQDRDVKRADVEALAESRFRLEQMVLAGRAPESDLTPVLAKEMEIKRSAAMAAIHVDDLEQEHAKLERDLPDLQLKTKQAVAHNLRQRSLDLMDELAACLDRASAIDQALYETYRLASDQFSVLPQAGTPPHGGVFYPGYSIQTPIGMQFRTIRADCIDAKTRIAHARESIERNDREASETQPGKR